MKPGELVQVRIPSGWVGFENIDGQMGLLLEIRPIEYPVRGNREHDYIVLVNGSSRIFKKRFLDRVYG